MVDAISITLSGLTALNQRLAVSANNIANANTDGVLPTKISPASTVYKPLSVSYAALTAGNQGAGVRATVTEDPQGFTAVYNPSSVYANKDGLTAAPNVDLAKESVNILETKTLFKANVSVIKAQNKMLDDLLNIIT